MSGYLPGQAVVPCAVCQTSIDRRGKKGRGHLKYCSDPCRKVGRLADDRARRGYQRSYRRDGICPRCGVNPRPVTDTGRMRAWCRRCESDQKAEYCRSPAGKATTRRWAEHHGRMRGPEYVVCGWCAEPVYRREKVGAGNRKFCNTTCRSAAYKARKRSYP